MADSAAGTGTGTGTGGVELGAGEVAELRRLLADLEHQNSELQVFGWPE